MKNICSYPEWEALNELRGLSSPFKIYSEGHGWEEIHRESITINDGGTDKEVGHISFGVANNPSNNRFFAIVNIETFPISGWGSHQIMTVHQSEHEEREDAMKELESHWNSLSFKKIKIKRVEYPTVGFEPKNKNEKI